MSNNDIVHKQYGPIVGWIFMTIWMSMLGIGIHSVIRDGLPGQMPPEIEIGVFGLFLIFGICGTMYMFYMPLVFLRVKGSHITVKQVWLFRTRTIKGRLSDIPEIKLVTDKDSDGDNYYMAIITLEDEGDVSFFQSHKKEKTKEVVNDLNDRIAAYKS